jgi:putative solute:sodium symporter small subunit
VDDGQRKAYWRRNVRLIAILLSIWFAVSYGAGILFVEALNAAGTIFNVPLGFWFAQQGSIITFVVLIGVYVLMMDRLDDEFGVAERDEHGRRH